MTRQTKARCLLALLLMMVGYVLYVFYLSEPKYIDNYHKTIEVGDIFVLERYSWGGTNGEVEQFYVLQKDSTGFLSKNIAHGFMSVGGRDYVMAPLRPDYHIVGRGTIYHRINQYVGFNVMFTTQIVIGILLAVLIMTSSKLLADVFEQR